MNSDDYQILAMRTNDDNGLALLDRLLETADLSKKVCEPGDLLNGALGITGEAGEVADIIKKYIFHGHELDREELIKEIGDVLWYVALLCETIDVEISFVMEENIKKLKERYPDGFSPERSINRLN